MLEVRDPELKDFIDSWHKPVDDEMAALRRSDESDGVPLILTETESVLRLLLDMKKPLRILELGTAHGLPGCRRNYYRQEPGHDGLCQGEF